MNRNEDHTLLDAIMRAFWLAVGVVCIILTLKAMAWADEGSRDTPDTIHGINQPR